MANSISLSASMRSNLLALQDTSMMQDLTQGRLATGKKVNSAIDNPASYFTAASLNNRATDLSARLDGIGQALQTLKAVSKSLDGLTTLVGQAQALAKQADEAAGATVSTLTTAQVKSVDGLSVTTLIGASTTTSLSAAWAGLAANTAAAVFKISVNGATAQTVDLTATDVTTVSITALLTIINALSSLSSAGVTATYNTTSNQIDFVAKAGTTIQIDETTTTGATVLFGANVGSTNIHTFSNPSATSSQLLVAAFGVTANDSFDIEVSNPAAGTNATTISVAISVADTIATFVTKLNAIDSSLSASYNTTSGKIDFSAAAGTSVQIVEGAGGGAGAEVFGSARVGTTNDLVFGTSNSGTAVAKNFADFKTVMTQIDQLVADSSYKGTNLLKGSASMSVSFNEDGSSALTVQGVDYTYTNLGMTNTTSLNWGSTAGDIQKSVTQAKEALDTIRSQAATFGTSNSIIQTRNDFTKNMVDTLKSGSDKLVLADMNEEAANMLALQTQRQMATNSLSMASQAAQSVLQMFR